MSSKLNIYSIILTLVLSFVTTNHLLLNQNIISSSTLANNKPQVHSDCCQPITDCCEKINSELAKCLRCYINDKQPNQFKSLKFKLQLGKSLNLTASNETQNKTPNYLTKDAFFIQQNYFNKDYQQDRPMSYSYLENIHTTLLLI